MSSDKQCPVCLGEIGEKNSCVTECGHTFCLKCLLRAAQVNTACPMCRNVLVDPAPCLEPEDIESAFEHGREEGYEEGRLDQAIEYSEEFDIEKQKAYDGGFINGRTRAEEDLRLLREELERIKQQLPISNSLVQTAQKRCVSPIFRPPSPYIYFKSRPENQEAIQEAAQQINDETGRPFGGHVGACIVWSQLSGEEKEMWKERAIASVGL